MTYLNKLQQQILTPKTPLPQGCSRLENEAWVQVGKGDIETFNMLSCQKIDDKYFIVKYGKDSNKVIVDLNTCYGRTHDGEWWSVREDDYEIVKEAILARRNRFMLDNYTFVVAYCLAKGLDLEGWVFDKIERY